MMAKNEVGMMQNEAVGAFLRCCTTTKYSRALQKYLSGTVSLLGRDL